MKSRNFENYQKKIRFLYNSTKQAKNSPNKIPECSKHHIDKPCMCVHIDIYVLFINKYL